MQFHTKLIKVVRRPSIAQKKLSQFLIRQKKARLNLEKERVRSLEFSSTRFGVDAQALYSEYVNSDFKEWYDSRNAELNKIIGNSHITSDFDCETLYLLVRSLKPDIVVETGVLYGASSSHILEAMERNQKGRLFSIDLPVKPNKLGQDFLVRQSAKERWRLILGDSRAELPKLLGRLQGIDHFHHDSLHSFDHMLWEYETALAYLSPGGILTSHDVVSLPFQKSAFEVFCGRNHLRSAIFRNVGIACMPSQSGFLRKMRPHGASLRAAADGLVP